MKIALYARVSSERQAEKDLSIPAQIKSLKKYALDHDWDVVAEYIDEAESARTANRPAFQKMIAAAKQREKQFDTILVWKLSRFARNREDSILHKSLLRKMGISVMSINEKVDESPAGQLLEGIIEVIDEFYSVNLSQDTFRGMRENAARGFSNGGLTAFGYERVKVLVGGSEKSTLVLEEKEAPVVQRAFRMALHGKGGKEIASAFNADGLTTRSGRHFSTTAINHILRNEVYIGTLVWNKKQVNRQDGATKESSESVRITNAHPAIVAREDFDRVQRLLTDRRPSVRHPRTVSSKYLLSGFLHCSKCGSAMIGSCAKSGQFFYYQCNNHRKKGNQACDSPAINRGKLESFVIDRVRQRILTKANLEQLVVLVNKELAKNSDLHEKRLAEIEGQLDQLGDKLSKLYAALETGKVDIDDLAPRLKELRVQQGELKGKREELLDKGNSKTNSAVDVRLVQGYVSDLKDLLLSASFLERKTFLRSFIKRVEFSPLQVAIDYTVPLPHEEGLTSRKEVLRINESGSPGRIRTYDLAVNSRPLYR